MKLINDPIIYIFGADFSEGGMQDEKHSSDAIVGMDPQAEALVLTWQDCKNCGYHYQGNFCPSCGQSKKEYQQPLGHFIGDFLGSLFAMDIRLFNTIPALLFRPGKVSAEFVDGRRKTHVAPFRLYFFISLIFFFLMGYQTSKVVDSEISVEDLNQDRRIFTMKTDAGFKARMDSLAESAGPGRKIGMLETIRNDLKTDLESGDLTEEERSEREKWYGYLGNPDVIINKVYQYVSWAFFLLMPLLAFIFYLFFRKKRKFYVEHLVYSVNLHSFLFLLLSVVAALGLLFTGLVQKIDFFVFLLVLIYSVIGIRKFYQQTWWRAIYKTFVIMLLYAITTVTVVLTTFVLLMTNL